MENRMLKFVPIFILLLITMTSCEAIEAIFKTGFNLGILAVILVIAGAVYLFSKMRK